MHSAPISLDAHKQMQVSARIILCLCRHRPREVGMREKPGFTRFCNKCEPGGCLQTVRKRAINMWFLQEHRKGIFSYFVVASVWLLPGVYWGGLWMAVSLPSFLLCCLSSSLSSWKQPEGCQGSVGPQREKDYQWLEKWLLLESRNLP